MKEPLIPDISIGHVTSLEKKNEGGTIHRQTPQTVPRATNSPPLTGKAREELRGS